MHKNVFLVVFLLSGSIYAGEKFAVALPAEPKDQVTSNWGHEEFNSTLPDDVVKLIMTEAILGNKVSELGLRTETRQVNPKNQVTSYEEQLKDRRYQPNSAEFQRFINNLVDHLSEAIQNHASRLKLAEDGFVGVTKSMVSFAQNEQDEYDKALAHYQSLPSSTQIQNSLDSVINRLFFNLGTKLSPEIRKKFDDIFREFRSLNIENPEQIIATALRSGVISALNMLQMMIHQTKQHIEHQAKQHMEQQRLAEIENKK